MVINLWPRFLAHSVVYIRVGVNMRVTSFPFVSIENARPENDGQTCGHSRFCAQCADAVAVMPNGCPQCRTPIDMVMRVYF